MINCVDKVDWLIDEMIKCWLAFVIVKLCNCYVTVGTARTSYGWLVVDLVNVGILKEEEMSGHWHWHVGKHVGFNG